MEYVGSSGDEDQECIFCAGLGRGDADAWILCRAEKTFALLNAYPYNTGHLMVAPTRHVADVTEMDAEERAELMEITIRSVAALREAMSPDGCNIGMNLGRVAGAGIPGHLHVHVVPRWSGDTNFMPVVGNTKVLPEMIDDTYRKLRPVFERI